MKSPIHTLPEPVKVRAVTRLPGRRNRLTQAAPLAASAASASPPALAPESLGWSLLLAARMLATVRAGKSLNEAMLGLRGEPGGARSAAQDAVFGALRRFGWGDFILSRLMSRPLTHEETRALLLVALYRLDTRPDSEPMVVDQAVRAAGELAGGVFKGLVNGVLRNYLRQREALGKAAVEDEEAWFWHPRWWLARLKRTHPQDWESIVRAGNELPPMSLRVNQQHATCGEYLARLQEAGVAGRLVHGNAILLDRPVAVEDLPGFFAGDVSVQDAGAQRAAELLAPLAGMRVLDACAAPGGKSAHLLEMARIDLLALDIDATRTRRIEENLQRLGLMGRVRTADCSDLASWWDGRAFDAILADVPCSASGVVRRHPDIKTLRRESDIHQFARMQAKILDALWQTLKPGGQLLYATCSVFGEENSGQIDAFLVRQETAQRVHEEQLLPQDENDGFYYALLRKSA